MFCSTIIPSIGRSTLERSVVSVLEQDFKEAKFEVIVVNDSGQPLAPAAWQESKLVQIINTTKRHKSIARNTGAAIAKGDYLHFLDDDDWMLPGAYSSFWQVAREFNQAVLIYGSSQLLDRKGQLLCQLNHKWISNDNWVVPMLAGEWLATESYMIKSKTFFEVGGATPNMPTYQERDVCRRVALQGDFAGTADVVSCHYMGEENSTTDFARGDLDNKISQEIMLNESEAFSRLTSSANSSYWKGRVVRGYLASAIWNLKQKKGSAVISRSWHSLGAFLRAGKGVFSKDFWDASTKPYISNSYIYEGDPRYKETEIYK